MVSRLVEADEARPTCVWMDAGLMNYKLCDRNFDCEHCPFDAALHGLPPAIAAAHIERASANRCLVEFPEDRRYDAGHTWLLVCRKDGCIRIGVDGFVASLLPEPQRVLPEAGPGRVRRGQPLCAIEMACGRLELQSPVSGAVARWNVTLRDDPRWLIQSPYELGWIVELTASGELALAGSVSSAVAARRAKLDYRRFLRWAGQRLLLEQRSTDAAGSNGGMAWDVRRIVGDAELSRMLQDLVR